MPRFIVLITRDVTESTSVIVEAADAEAAEAAAFAASSDPHITAIDPMDGEVCVDRGLPVTPRLQSPLAGTGPSPLRRAVQDRTVLGALPGTFATSFPEAR